MRNFLQFGLLATAFSLAAATPVPVEKRQDVTEYYLKTEVTSGDATKDGLYVEAYHTAAGFNDAVLGTNLDVAAKGYLNGTDWEFDLGTSYPWGLVLYEEDIYSEWNPVEINTGYGTGNFSLDSAGNLVGSSYYEWTGWIACDWSKGAPQLFWRYYYTDITLPSTCANVNLVPVEV